MSSNQTSTTDQFTSKENYSTVKELTTPSINNNNNNNDTKSRTSTLAQRQYQGQPYPSNEYWTSTNTSVSDPSAMSSTTSSRSPASSTRGGSSIDSFKRPLVAVEPRRSPVDRVMDKAKSKLGRSTNGAEALPNDELEYERQHAKAAEKQRRQEEYERLGLGNRTKYGMPGRPSYF